MLTLSRQELQAMSRDDVVKHVLALQSEKEIKMRLNEAILARASKEALIDHAILLQSEIEWQRVRDITSGGAG